MSQGKLAVGIAAVLLACSCKREVKPAPVAVIRFGQVLDRTGSMATPSWSSSVRLAIGTANQALKKAGRNELRFELVEANSGNAQETARSSATQLVRTQGARAIITDSSQDDIAIHMLAYGEPGENLQVPIVCMACTAPEINDPAATDTNPVKQAALRNSAHWNFRTAMSASYQARMIIRMLLGAVRAGDVNGDGHFKLSIYASDDPYGRGFSDQLKALALRARPSASVEQLFVNAQVDAAVYDWSADVRKLVDNRNESLGGKVDGVPDAVVEITFPKFSAAFTRAWLSSGSKVRMVHTHNFRTARLIEVLGDRANGQEGTSQVVVSDGPSGDTFAEDLRAATGQPPAFRDASAYDAAASLVLAALVAVQSEKLEDPAGLSGAQLRSALTRINVRGGEPVFAGIEGMARAVRIIQEGRPINYVGASGPCDFDANGDVVAQLARFRVQNQGFVDVERYDCIKDKDCPPLVATTLTTR